MSQNSQDTSNNEYNNIVSHMNDRERHLVQKILKRQHVSRDIGQEFHESLTFGQKVSDKMALYAGSWPFVIVFILILLAWIILNSIFLPPSGKAFDPYPYILLNLFLSMLAAIQAPIILMSQNRQSAKDRAEASHDYEVNLKSELEVTALHLKIDQLRDDQMKRMIDLEDIQLKMLEQIRDLLLNSSLDNAG